MRYLLLAIFLSGCTTVTVNIPPGATGGSYSITVNANKQIPFSGSISPSGNTVPLSAMP